MSNPSMPVILADGVQIPIYGTNESAAFDIRVYGLEDPVVLGPGDFAKFRSGLKIDLRSVLKKLDMLPFIKLALLIIPRSGLGINHGIVIRNLVGLIDQDYQKEIVLGIVNTSKEPYTIHPNEKIAQCLIVPTIAVDFEQVDEFEDPSDRGGLGSTGRF